jgi:phytoene dehydrogenase-like protein
MNTETRSHSSIVIGGGLAGLAAATYLARGGARVTLLEKADKPGGRASTDTSAGFALNRGAHALYTGGSSSAVLRELGVTYASGRPSRLFARDERGLHVLPATPLDMLRTDLLDAADKADLLRLFMGVGKVKAESVAHMSAQAWIARATGRPRVRALFEAMARVYLYSAAIDLASAETFIDKLHQTLKYPIHYVDGGWQTLVDGLRAAATAAGVEVRTSSSVAAVSTRAGRATHVQLHDGVSLACDSVLIALPPEDAQRLVPLEAELTPVHIACLDLALSRLPDPRHPVVFDLVRPRFLTAQSEFAHLAPQGGAVVHAFLHLDPRTHGDPQAERAELEAFVDEVQPGWRDVVVERRFLPRMLAAGALPLAASGGQAARPGYRSSSVDNVFFAGDWVGPIGFLADASLASARAATRRMLQRERQPRDAELLVA